MVNNRGDHVKRFSCSGAAVITAAICTNPIDVIKIRLQLDNQLSDKKNIFADRYYRGFVRGSIQIIKDEGFNGLSKGVKASVLREGIYSTFRLGAYEPVKHLFGATEPCAPLYKKIIAGAIVGAIGSAIASPCDLVKIRIQAEGRLKPGEVTQYPSTFGTFKEIVAKEGIIGLYRGVGPTVLRASILTAAQIPSYDHTKNTIIHKNLMQEGLPLHMLSSFIAGFVTVVVTSPVDVIKTRIMHENTVHCNKLQYSSSSTQCFKQIFLTEGLLGFYKGFIPNWFRITPHTIITFMIFEQLRKLAGLKPV